MSHDDFSRDVLASSPDTCPGQISWDYDRAEIIADGVVHAIGVCLGLIGVTIVVTAVNIERIEIAPILAYVIGLVTNSRSRLLTTYVSPAKWVLRRFDHSAIQVSGRDLTLRRLIKPPITEEEIAAKEKDIKRLRVRLGLSSWCKRYAGQMEQARILVQVLRRQN